jgi:hypothetical protein
MQAVLLPKEQFEILIGSLTELKKANKRKREAGKIIIDNAEFIQMMNITDRTARTWRSKKILPFSKVGRKIYYKLDDIETLLNQRYIAR